MPMDIGRVGWHDDHDHDHDDHEISAIGQHTQCYKCGGGAHMSRECPSEKKGKKEGKDFGKGGKGYGKGVRTPAREVRSADKGTRALAFTAVKSATRLGSVAAVSRWEPWMKKTMESMK